jgi:hypothetical protein
MVAAGAPSLSPTLQRRGFERWRRRSRLIRRLRVILPLLIAAIFAALVGQVVHHTLTSKAQQEEAEGPIRLSNPRFVGRDGRGRAFVLTADAAVRDERDFQRVILLRPAVVIDEAGDNPTRLTCGFPARRPPSTPPLRSMTPRPACWLVQAPFRAQGPLEKSTRSPMACTTRAVA